MIDILKVIQGLDEARTKASHVLVEELRAVRGDAANQLQARASELKAYVKDKLLDTMIKLTED